MEAVGSGQWVVGRRQEAVGSGQEQEAGAGGRSRRQKAGGRRQEAVSSGQWAGAGGRSRRQEQEAGAGGKSGGKPTFPTSRHSHLSTIQHSALSTQDSALSTQDSALRTRTPKIPALEEPTAASVTACSCPQNNCRLVCTRRLQLPRRWRISPDSSPTPGCSWDSRVDDRPCCSYCR
jgi:hypothetical protein